MLLLSRWSRCRGGQERRGLGCLAALALLAEAAAVDLLEEATAHAHLGLGLGRLRTHFVSELPHLRDKRELCAAKEGEGKGDARAAG